MEVEVGRQDPLGEVVDLLGKATRDVAVAKVLADDRAVLALGQGVVVGAARARLGELGMKLRQQGGDAGVDVA